MALTPERKILKSGYLWLGVLACAAIALPNLVWQIRNHFPFLELMHNVRMSGRDVARAPLAFIVDQMMIMNPLLAPLWVGGVFWLFFGSRGKRYRVLGWCFLVVLITLMAMKAKELLRNADLSNIVCSRRDWLGGSDGPQSGLFGWQIG